MSLDLTQPPSSGGARAARSTRAADADGADAVRELPPIRPDDRGKPILGRAFEYAKDPFALFRRQWDHYGPVAPISMLGQRWVMLLGPDACEEAFRNKDKAFANGPAWTYLVGPFFDRGLMLLDFEEHHMHRRIMQQAFTRDRLEAYAARMHAPIEAGLAGWAAAGRDRDFAAYPSLKQLTLDVAADIFMGGAEDTTPAEMAKVNQAFIACVQAAAAVVRKDLPGTRWGRGHRGREVLEEFLRHYLPSRRAVETDDLFSQLCHIESDEGERFSDDDVVNHMIFLMMAAHDTSTITLSTMLQMLGQHPAWQQRCREESLALGPRPSLAELEGLEAMDWVMKECLRLRAPVPVVLRQVVKDTVVQGVRIPEGTFVTVAPQFAQVMEELWTNPLVFDPERFSPERREDKSHRYAWNPFGGGVHKCLGMYFAGAEVKAVLHHLLRGWEWSVDPGYVAPMNNHSLPFPKDGQPIDLRRTR
ncbi:cytochrome P450 [Nocardioides sp. SOB77]|uniref:Cytochrome P450 n=1 Tax=Nocardioides oceani TaxID=3058369 RepID=A0ABT8FHS2_9ACTN|nr:cytochrome P450 [Nocardioides oceani]MDN4174241.1 cytochrome P450 [Nocardioides oceani]